jgi:hypothetical protein
MSGSYLGGSTIVRIWPAKKKKVAVRSYNDFAKTADPASVAKGFEVVRDGQVIARGDDAGKAPELSSVERKMRGKKKLMKMQKRGKKRRRRTKKK